MVEFTAHLYPQRIKHIQKKWDMLHKVKENNIGRKFFYPLICDKL